MCAVAPATRMLVAVPCGGQPTRHVAIPRHGGVCDAVAEHNHKGFGCSAPAGAPSLWHGSYAMMHPSSRPCFGRGGQTHMVCMSVPPGITEYAWRVLSEVLEVGIWTRDSARGLAMTDKGQCPGPWVTESG
eukprot:257493-Chlamydomonas_euryale.AAC.3